MSVSINIDTKEALLTICPIRIKTNAEMRDHSDKKATRTHNKTKAHITYEI